MNAVFVAAMSGVALLAVTTATAKEAFAKAIEWHIIERFVEI